jgi:accessory gene regulator protein AgrB
MTTDTFLKPGLNIIIIDVLILTGIITAISVFAGHADIVLLLSWIIVAAYTAMAHRYISLSHLLMSTLLAVAWVYLARENYGYNHSYITIAGVNLLPLLAWSLGLVGVSEIFNHFKTKRRINNFILFIPIFWILLILIETYAFHVIEIRDTLSGNTIGLPFCNCIHAPWWMRFVYFSLGPIYYALTMLSDSLILKYSNLD